MAMPAPQAVGLPMALEEAADEAIRAQVAAAETQVYGQVHVEVQPVLVAGAHTVDAFAHDSDPYMSSSEEDFVDAAEVFLL